MAEAVIEEHKITRYLLSVTHSTGCHKAQWLISHGFELQRWQLLADAIRRHAAVHEVVLAEDSPHGTRYVVEGVLETPDGRCPDVRTVWFIEAGERTPRFVTLYPMRRSER